MSKRGFTLIELVVAMGIFAVLAVLLTGAYVTVMRMKDFTKTERDTQQKLRVAEEIITRLARQADRVKLPTADKFFYDANKPECRPLGQPAPNPPIPPEYFYPSVELYFNTSPPSAAKFAFEDDGSGKNYKTLKYYDKCNTFATDGSCANDWGTSTDLFSGDFKSLNGTCPSEESGFQKDGVKVPSLYVSIYGIVTGLNANNPYLSDRLGISTRINLENLK